MRADGWPESKLPDGIWSADRADLGRVELDAVQPLLRRAAAEGRTVVKIGPLWRRTTWRFRETYRAVREAEGDRLTL